MNGDGGYKANANVVPFNVNAVVAKYKLLVESTNVKFYHIYQSLCLPSSCNDGDLNQILQYNQNLRNGYIVQDGSLLELRILRQKYKIYHDTNFLVIM
jgi:hypothetical protein